MKFLVILGGGESGVGTAILKNVLEHFEIDWEEEQHSEALILKADVVMKSPGIPDSAPLVIELAQNGIPVISEIEFATHYTDAKIIGITGSNGKTTTTMLTNHLLKGGDCNNQYNARPFRPV